MYLQVEARYLNKHRIKKLIKTIIQGSSLMSIENNITHANYQILLKGIWTGVLISLIVHQFINH